MLRSLYNFNENFMIHFMILKSDLLEFQWMMHNMNNNPLLKFYFKYQNQYNIHFLLIYLIYLWKYLKAFEYKWDTSVILNFSYLFAIINSFFECINDCPFNTWINIEHNASCVECEFPLMWMKDYANHMHQLAM
jgi:hypothetical protein